MLLLFSNATPAVQVLFLLSREMLSEMQYKGHHDKCRDKRSCANSAIAKPRAKFGTRNTNSKI